MKFCWFFGINFYSSSPSLSSYLEVYVSIKYINVSTRLNNGHGNNNNNNAKTTLTTKSQFMNFYHLFSVESVLVYVCVIRIRQGQLCRNQGSKYVIRGEFRRYLSHASLQLFNGGLSNSIAELRNNRTC